MGDRLGIAAGPHRLARENRHDVISLTAVVLVPGEELTSAMAAILDRIRAHWPTREPDPGPSFALHFLYSPWLLVAVAIVAWITFRPRRSQR